MQAFKYEVSICAIYRNEADYLAEWIEYYLLMGINHFYLYNNLSDDNHRVILDPYIARGLVTYHEHNVDLGSMSMAEFWKDPNFPYKHVIRHYKHESKWIGFFDLDEFVVIYDGRSIPRFMDDYIGYSGLAIHQLIFGTSGHYLEPPGLVIENYTLRTSKNLQCNLFVKSIINPRTWINAVDPHIPVVNGTIVCEDMSPCLISCPSPILHRKCAVYHFSCKSKEYYIYKKFGRVWDLQKFRTPVVNQNAEHSDDFKNRFYPHITRWEDYNTLPFNCVEDTTLLKYAPLIRRRISVAPSSPSIRLIDGKKYLHGHPDFQQYYKTNLRAFYGQSMSIIFHYWFIFEEKNPASVSMITSDIITSDLDRSKYTTGGFLNYIRSVTHETVSPSKSLIDKFFIDYEMWCPSGFDWKYYTTKYPDLARLNEFQAREHWVTYGQYEGRYYNSDMENSLNGFDWKCYTTRYPDLAHFNAEEALTHWLTYGRFEGRSGVPT